MNQVTFRTKNLCSIIFITTLLTFLLMISSSYSEWAYFAKETTDTSKKLLKADRIKNIDWNEKLKQLTAQIPNSKNWPVQDQFVPDELVIKYKKNVSNAAISFKENKESLTVKKISKHLGFRVVKIPKGKSVKELVAQFAKDSDVEFAEPNYYRHIYFFPDDQYLNLTGQETANATGWYPMTENPPAWTDVSTGQQFNYYTYLPYTLFGMRMPSLPQPYTSYISDSGAWEITRGSGNVRVAIIDTGVMMGHEDLLDRVDRGYDYVNGDGMPLDDNGHGTHCAGIVAANIDNNRGVCGMAPESTIIPIKVLDAGGGGTSADVAEGIIGAARDFHANILSLSLGGYGYTEAESQAVQAAFAEGAIIVAAAGNDGVDFRITPSYPAGFPRVITVGSFNYRGTYDLTMQTTGNGVPIPTAYSNFGYSTGRTNATDNGVEIYAPGGDPDTYPVFSTFPYDVGGTRYAPEMGTSMACPQVAGLCALLFSQGIRSVDAMTYALWSTSQSPYPPYPHGVPDPNEIFGFGVIDPRYALQFAKNFTIPAGVGFVNFTLDDDNLNGTQGNNNKLLNPGEIVDISISIQNIGASNLINVFGKLTSSDPYVSIYTSQQVQSFGNISPGSIVTSAGAYRFFVNADARSGYIIPFKLLVTDSATWNDANPVIIPFEVTVFVKGPVAVAYLNVNDSGQRTTNNGNGIWNTSPPELVDLSVAVHNYGIDTLLGIRIDLTNFPPNFYFGNGMFGVERESYLGYTVTDWNQYAGDTLFPGFNSDTISFRIDFVGDTVYSILPSGEMTYSKSSDNVSIPLYAYITDSEGNTWVDTVTVQLYTHDTTFFLLQNLPHLIHDDPDLSADNNNDGQINPGETIRITQMRARNNTGRRAGATGTLRAEQWNSVTKSYEPDPWVTITDDLMYFNTVGSGSNSNSDGVYLNWLQFTVDPACPADHMIYFRIALFDGLWTKNCTFTHKVVRTRTSEVRMFYPNYTRWFDVNSHPNAIVDDINTTGFRGNYDGWLNPGETVKYIPPIDNMSWYTQFGPGYAYIVNNDQWITVLKSTTEIDPILPRGLSPGGLSRAQVNSIAFDSTSSNRYFILKVDENCPMDMPPDEHFYGYHHDFIFDTIVKDTIGREFIMYSVIPVVNSTPPYPDSYVSYNFIAGYSPQRVGFPLSLVTTFGNYTSGYIKTSPAVGDINNDGNDEIIVSVGTYDAGFGYVYVIDSVGRILPNWPQQIEGYIAESSPALADMNNDGILDTIVTGSGSAVGASQGRVYAWSLDGSPRNAQWGGVTTDRPINTTPVVADTNGNGTPEIIIGSKAWGSQSGKIYCFNTNGTLKWSFDVGSYVNIAASPAVGDINNDGKQEIVFETNATNPSTGQPYAGDLYALQDNGTAAFELWSTPLQSATYSAPALADMDWDGQQEIVFGALDSSINIYSSTGSLLRKFNDFSLTYGNFTISNPIRADISSAPAIADLNGDTYPEIIAAGADSQVYSITYDVNSATYVPYSFFPYFLSSGTFGSNIRLGSPSIADVNTDGYAEIVVGANEYYDSGFDYIYEYPRSNDTGYHYNVHIIGPDAFSEAARSPMPTVGVIYGSPMFAKIGNKVNIVLGDLSHNVYIWETGFDYNPTVNVWNGFRHDAQRTGCYSSRGVIELMGLRYLKNILDYTSDDTSGLSYGNGNAEINPGETIEMGMILKNYTVSTLTNIYAILSSTDQNIASISVNSASFTDVGRYGLSTTIDRFVFTVSTTASSISYITFQLDLYSSGTSGQKHTTETIYVPLIQLNQEIIMVPPPILNDSKTPPSDGNNDGQVEANETIQLTLNLENTSWRTISGVVATLVTTDEYVTISQNASYFGTMLSQQVTLSSTAYVFTVSNAPNYHPIDFNLVIIGDGGYYTVQSFRLIVQPQGIRQTVFHRYYYNNARNAWRVEDGNNGFLTPSETGRLNMRLFNSGTTLTEVFGQMYQAYGAPVGISNSSQQYWSMVTVINNDTVIVVYTISSSSSAYSINIGTSELYDHPIFEWELSGIDTAGVFHRWVDRMGLSIASTGLLCYAWDSINDRISGLDGTYGNGNGILDPGETIQLDIGLMNNSNYNAAIDPNYHVRISTPDTQYVTLLDPYGRYPSDRVNANSVSFNHNDSFKLYVANTCPDNYVITLNLDLRYEINTAAVLWAWSYDTTLEMAVSNYPDWTINSTGTMSIITTIPVKLYMGSFNYYELPGRRHSLRITDDATLNTSTTWANSDGTANPGETIDVRLRLWNRSTSEFVGSVMGWLIPANEYTRTHVTLLNSTCYFTGAEPRGIATPIAPYFRMRIGDNVSQFTAVFNLYTTDSSSMPPRIRWNTNITIPVSKGRPRYVPGFPIYIGAAIKSSPVLVDLNHNGVTDIIVGAQDSTVYAYEYNWANSVANPIPGWPKRVNGAVFASPAVGDIFGTGENYVVAATMYGSIYIWDSAGNLLNGWPITLVGNPAVEASPVLADVDHDGRLDIIVAARQSRSVYCFDALTGLKWYNSAIGEINSTPAVANIMNDTTGYLQTVYASQDGLLSIVDHTGQLIWQASAGGSFYSSPAIADLNNDENMEIVIGCNDQNLYMFRYNQSIQNWESFPPISVDGSIIGSPAVGNLPGDSTTLSVVFGTNAAKVYSYAWDAPYNNLTQQWEATLGDAISNSPAIGDINGDTMRETIVGAQDGLLYWYQDIGARPAAWNDFNPLSLLGTRIDSSPAIGDVMGDHSCCIVVGDNSGYLYAIAMAGPGLPAPYFSERMEWPMFHHDPEHTGLYSTPQPTYLNSNGSFSKANDTTSWYIQAYGDADPAPGAGTINWLPSFGNQTGVLELQQNIGQKAKLTQVFSVPSSGWYTASAKIATNVAITSNQQKVYLYLQELASDNAVAANGNLVIAYGKGGLGSANTWRNMKISFYATNTVLGVQIVGINHQENGVNDARLYLDDVLVSAGVTLSTTTVALTNPNFDTDTSGWLLETYADGIAPGTWSWLSYLAGHNGMIQGTQVAGEKGKMSQFADLPYAQHDATGSVWVYSDALSVADTQKVYLYLYSYDNSGYSNIVESGNAILQAGKWIPGTWRQLQFGYAPLTVFNAVQLVGINPVGRPTQSIYFDDLVVEQD